MNPRPSSFGALRLAAALLLLLNLSGPVHAALIARGSDSTMHVVKALAVAFEKTSGGETIALEGGGSGAGAKGTIAGEVQLAFLSRALTDKEKADGLVGTVYAVDGVALIAHPANPQGDVTLAELKALFTGQADAWRDGKPVALFNRNADSGTRELFQEVVLGKGTAFTDKAAVKHDGILLSSVAKIPSALAYTSVAEAAAVSSVKTLTVGGIAATPETLRNRTYPIVRTPTLATKGEPQGAAKAFIEFVLSPAGQAIVGAEKLVPLR